MRIGQTIKVYHYRPDLSNKAAVCNLGCKHWVTYHEVKRVTITAARKELVPYLAYTQDAVGDVFDAVDAQGRLYTFTPTWDGPGTWRRAVDSKNFHGRPILRMDAAFTLDGKPIA